MLHHPRMTRRDFFKTSTAGVVATSAISRSWAQTTAAPATTKVVLIKTTDRAQGVAGVLKSLSFPAPQGKKVFVKPNFNTADPPPGSTHNETLRALILELKSRGASGIVIGDRCGPGNTKTVMEEKGIPGLASELGAEVMNFEELGPENWIRIRPPESHWKDGFDFARPLAEAEFAVATCCLKTHQYGGVHTMSLKLSVGAVHRQFMRELHGSPDQRKMIAEINLGYRPKLIVMDGVEAFVDGGPMTGKLVAAGVVLAATDRVAIDAVGLAVLKDLGTTEAIMSKKIFEQDQLARAVELGLGAADSNRIELVPGDQASRAYVDRIKAVLARG
jgi:uncharacterized protein (DUF362 family)